MTAIAGPAKPVRTRDALRQSDFWRFLTNVPFVLGTLGICAIVLAALFGPQIAPADPQAQRVVIFYPDASFKSVPTPPDQYYLLGTDPLGRDQLSRLLWGARLTLTIVLLGLLGRGALALLLGVLAGWRRGSWLDHAIGHVTSAVSGLPQLMLALLLVIALQDHGITGFVLALALVGWAELAQFVRGEVARALATPHVQAARALGARGAHVLRTHVLRDLAPQILGVLALEAGSVLLLLAELGFIGFFVAGGVFYVDDSGRPILPVRDRAPEWGQMLAGARNYAFRDQYVAFVPGVVVVSAVLAFNLFAEGLRTASDPFSPSRLSPRALGAIGRTLLAGGVLAAVAFGYVSASSTSISYAEGLRRAKEASARVLPGGELVAGIVRYASSEHAMGRPERLTYYFRDERSRILRVTFLDADANAMDVKLHSNEDGLTFAALGTLPADGLVEPDRALAAAEEIDGTRFRNANRTYTVRLLLAQDPGSETPLFRIEYAVPGGRPTEIRVNARDGSTSLPAAALLADAFSRAEIVLRGTARLNQISVHWYSGGPGRHNVFGAERPAEYRLGFVRGDARVAETVSVTYSAGREGLARLSQGSMGGTVDSTTMPIPPFTVADLVVAFEKAEQAGLRAKREQWVAEGYGLWQQIAYATMVPAGPVGTGPAGQGWSIDVHLFAERVSAASDRRFATFNFDPSTGQVRETDRFRGPSFGP